MQEALNQVFESVFYLETTQIAYLGAFLMFAYTFLKFFIIQEKEIRDTFNSFLSVFSLIIAFLVICRTQDGEPYLSLVVLITSTIYIIRILSNTEVLRRNRKKAIIFFCFTFAFSTSLIWFFYQENLKGVDINVMLHETDTSTEKKYNSHIMSAWQNNVIWEFEEKYGIDVHLKPVKENLDARLDQFKLILEDKKNGIKQSNFDVDVFAIDHVWTNELDKYAEDLSELTTNRKGFFHKEEKQVFFEELINNSKKDNRIVAIPWYVDFGLIFYRKDILDRYPEIVENNKLETWNEFEAIAKEIQNKERDKIIKRETKKFSIGMQNTLDKISSSTPKGEIKKYLVNDIKDTLKNQSIWLKNENLKQEIENLVKQKSIELSESEIEEILKKSQKNLPGYDKDLPGFDDEVFWGFIWEGKKGEGFHCVSLEWIASHGGGDFWLTKDKDETELDKDYQKSAEALIRAKGWIGQISPSKMLEKDGNEVLDMWLSGKALFMRHWPYAYYGLNNQQANNFSIDDVGVMTLPRDKNMDDSVSVSTLGGWQLMVNKYSSHKKRKAAKKFVEFLTMDVESEVEFLTKDPELGEIKETVSPPLSLTLQTGKFPALKQLYDNDQKLHKENIQDKLPFNIFRKTSKKFQEAKDLEGTLKDNVVFVNRPSKTENYNQKSKQFATKVHEILVEDKPIPNNINDLQDSQKDIVKDNIVKKLKE